MGMVLAITYVAVALTVEAAFLLENLLIIRKKSDYLLYMSIRGERRNDPDVVRLVKQYKAELWKFATGIFVLSFGFFLCGEYASFGTLYLTAWCTAAILGDYRLVKKYAGRMYELKKEKGWCRPVKQTNCKVDTAVSRRKKTFPVSELWMFLPFWICVGSLFWYFLYGSEYTVLLLFPIANVAVVLLFFYLFHLAAHRKLKVYSEDSEINYILNKTAGRAWTTCIVLEEILLCLYQFYLMVWLHSYMKEIKTNGVPADDVGRWILFAGVSVLVTGLSVWALLSAAARVKKVKKELAAGAEEFWKEDEDACWKNGYYYNPEDTNTFVENRCYGITTNMATVWGKITKWTLLVTLFVCIGLGIAMLPLDFGTVTIEQKENGIEVRGGWYYKERLAFEDIKEVTLLEESPELSRVFGSGMKHMALGEYHLKGYGSGRAVVYREAEYFILVEKTNGKLVIFSTEDAEEMLACYETLKERERTLEK